MLRGRVRAIHFGGIGGIGMSGIAETLRLCEAPQEVSSDNRPGDISFVETIFSLDCQPQSLGHDQTIVFFNDSETFRY